MKPRRRAPAFLAILFLTAAGGALFAGDSVYGKVRVMTSAGVVVFDFGAGTPKLRLAGGSGTYNLHFAGINVAPGFEAAAIKRLDELLGAGRNARMRLVGRAANGEIVSQLLTDNPDPHIGIKDIGVELVRSGLATRQSADDSRYGYKYGELKAAEDQARKGQRGVWASTLSPFSIPSPTVTPLPAPSPTSTPLPAPPSTSTPVPPPSPTPTWFVL